jgi:DUF4097 and DUF4098 domain-containing protein YvlB
MNDRQIEEYLDRVTRDMGQRQRKDVREELKSHILDSSEAVAAERNVAVDESIVREVLAKMGPPEKLAAAYPPSMRGSIVTDRVVLAGAAIAAVIVILLAAAGAFSACMLFASVPWSAGNVNAVEHRVDSTSHAGAANISLSVGTFGGNIEIVEAAGDQVEVTYDVRASRGHLGNVVTGTTYVLDGDTLKVSSEAKLADSRGLFPGTRGADALVKVPRGSQYRIILRTAGGDLAVPELNGSSLVLETFGGNVNVRGGNYQTITASTAGGNIDARYDATNVTFSCLGGNIALDTNQSSGSISATTAGGDIEVRLPEGSLFSVDATAFGGRISYGNIPMVLSQHGDMRLVGQAEAGRGNLTLELSTMGGNIEIMNL